MAIDSFAFQFECVLRVIIAALCGAIIGLERKNRLKEAGTRTHLVVAFGSALFMIVSKYGFFDIVQYAMANGTEALKVDPTRVASQVVTGIGFLGAGTIFVRRQVINGLTTAAGLWATAAIGMAIGAGQYIIGLFGAVILVCFQWFLHRVKFLNKVSPDIMIFRIEKCEHPVEMLKNVLDNFNITIQSVKVDKTSKNEIVVECLVKMPKAASPVELSDAISANENIISVEF